MNINKLDMAKRQKMVGMAKQMFDEGLTVREVADKMCISESTVRSVKKIIDNTNMNK